MPELPEIENLTRDLRRCVVGKKIVDVHVGQVKAINLPLDEFQRYVRGPVEGIGRHGKSAILQLPHGALWLHLGLGGVVELLADDPWPAAKFVSLRFDDDSQLSVDRVFMGRAHFVALGARPAGTELGIDALDPALTEEIFGSLLRRKPNQAVKVALMDQALLAGVGNTYSDEILHVAGLHPARVVATISDQQIHVLYRALRDVLERAITAGGEPDWHSLSGRAGRYLQLVHQATTCGTCAGRIQQITIGGRKGYFCPKCQPADAGAS